MSSFMNNSSPSSPVKSNWRVSQSATITPHQCEFCSKKFGDKVNLDSHLELWHEEDVNARLKADEERNISSSEVSSEEEESPQQNVKTDDTPSVPEENRIPDEVDELIQTDEDPQFSCSLCNKKFYRQANLDVHALTHLPKPLSKSKKKKVSSKFSKKKKKKPLSAEAERGEFPCQYCSKVFTYFFNCKRHEGSCQDSPEVQKSKAKGGELENTETNEEMICKYCATSCLSRSSQRHHEKLCSKNPDNMKSLEDKPSSHVLDSKSEKKKPDGNYSNTAVENIITCRYCLKPFSCNSSRNRHETQRCSLRPKTDCAEEASSPKENSVEPTELQSTSQTSAINCPHCSKSFNSRFAKARHVKHQCSKNPNRVKVKNTTWSAQENVSDTTEPKTDELDEETSTKIDEGTCKFCAKSFSTSSNRVKHEKISCLLNPESQMSLKRSEGGGGEVDSEEEEAPSNISNDSNDSLFKAASGKTCPYCSKDLSSRTNRRRHERTCSDNPSCGTKLAVKDEVSEKDAEQDDSLKLRTCQHCSKIFSSVSNSKLHERICFGNPNRLDPRNKLGPLGENSSALDKPISLTVTSTDPLSCKYCSKSYSDKSNRRRHEIKCAENTKVSDKGTGIVDGDPESKQQRTCQYCSKIFSLVSYRKLHEKVCSENSTERVPSTSNANCSPTSPSSPASPVSNTKTKPCRYCGKVITRNNVWRHEQSCSTNPAKQAAKGSDDNGSGNLHSTIPEESSSSDDYFVPVYKTPNSTSTSSFHKVGPKSRTSQPNSKSNATHVKLEVKKPKIKIGPMSSKKNMKSEKSVDESSLPHKLVSRSKLDLSNLKSQVSGSSFISTAKLPENKPIQRKGVSLPDSKKPIQLTWKGMQIFFPTVTIEKSTRNKADEALQARNSRDSNDGTEADSYDSSINNDRTETTNVNQRAQAESRSESSSPGPKWKIKASTSLAVSSPRSKLVACKICGIEYSNSSALDRHMFVHLGGNALERKYGPCVRCGARFTKSTYLSKHLELCKATGSLVSVIENSEPADCEIPSGDVKLKSLIEIADFEYSVKVEPNTEISEETAPASTNNAALGALDSELEDPQDTDFTMDAEDLNTSNDGSDFEVSVNSDDENSSQVTPRTTRSNAAKPHHSFNSYLRINSVTSLKSPNPATTTPQATSSSAKKPNEILHEEQYTNCGICLIKLKDEVAVIKHSKEHTKSESQKPVGSTFECMVCLKKFSTFPHFEQHMYWRHVKVAPVFKCDKCSETFPNKNSLAEHSVSHVKDDSTGNSDVAASKISSAPSKSVESSAHTTELEDKVAVDSTLSRTESKNTPLSSHKKKKPVRREETKSPIDAPNIGSRTPKAPVPLMYVCKFKDCQHFFSHDEDLWYHIEKKHKCFDDLCCSKCGQDFQTSDLLKTHVTIEHPEKSLEDRDESLSNQQGVGDAIITETISNDPEPDITQIEIDKDFEIFECSAADDPEDYYPGDEPAMDHSDAGPDISLLVPETKLVVERLNPYIKITPELKAAADSVLQKNPHLILQRTHKDKQGKFPCDICGNRSFWKKMNYVAHMSYHRQLLRAGIFRDLRKRDKVKRINIPMDRTCRICNRRFDADDSYRTYMQYHRTQKKKYGHYWVSGSKRQSLPLQDVYRCDICPDKEFTNRSNYFSHMTYHRIKQQKTGTPVISEQRGRSLREDIPLQDVYTCELCPDRKYKERARYIMHLDYHRKYAPGRSVGLTGGKPAREDIPFQDVYTCELCPDRNYKERNRYIMHLVYHKKYAPGRSVGLLGGKPVREDIPFQDVYTCELCPNRQFTERNRYMMHVDYHKKYAPSRSLGIGGKSAREDIPFQDVYTCDMCNGKQFENRAAYLSHLRYNHEQQGMFSPTPRKLSRPDIPVQDVYECTYCKNRVFHNRLSYIAHHDYHVKTGNFQPLARPPRKKITAAEVPIQDEYICERCDGERKFADRGKYILHMNYHDVLERRKLNQEALNKNPNQPVQGTFRCKICPDLKTFTDSSKFRAHIQYHKSRDRVSNATTTKESVTSGDETFSCLKCGEETVFTSRKLFLEHLQEHKQMKKLAYKCSLCQKGYSSSWILSEHMKSHKDKQYNCGDCGMSFQYSFSLRRHQENSCKRVPCAVECFCGDKFHCVQDLNRHSKRVHNIDIASTPGNTTWCHVCKKVLPSKSQLNDHVQVFHPEVYTEFIKDKVTKISVEVMASKTILEQRTGIAEPTFVSVDRHRSKDVDTSLTPQVVLEEDEDDGSIFQPQIVLDESAGDIMTPQVLLEEPTAEEEMNPQEVELDIENADVKLHTEGNNGEETATPEWQVFKGLEVTEETSDNEDDYDEYPTESFEPEDVEVDGMMPESVDPLTSNPPVMQNYSKQPEKPIQSSQLPAAKPRVRTQLTQIQKKLRGPLRYSCSHCEKSTAEPKYMLQHWNWAHKNKGLAYKFVDTATGETFCPDDRVVRRRKAPAAQSYSNVKDTPSEPQLKQPLPNAILDQPSASTPNTVSFQAQTSNSLKEPPEKPRILKRPGPKSRTVRLKSKQECSCAVSDTALGILKRCVSEECACYISNKGCSNDCTCVTVCNNPYFKRLAPQKSVPGLVPLGSGQVASGRTSEVSTKESDTSAVQTTSGIGNPYPRRNSVDAGMNSNSARSDQVASKSHPNLQDALNKLIENSVSNGPSGSTPSTQRYHDSQMSISDILNNSSPISNSNATSLVRPEPTPFQPSHLSTALSSPYSAQSHSQSQYVSPATYSYSLGQTVHTNTISPYNSSAALPVSFLTQTNPVAPVTPYVQPQSLVRPNTFHYQPSLYSQGSAAANSSQSTSYTYNPQFYGATQSHGVSSNNFGGSPSYPSNAFKCAHCNHSATCYSSYIGHQWEHRDKSQFLCPICVLWYNSVPELAEHARAHNNSQSSSSVQIPPSVPQLPQISLDTVQCFATACASRFKTSDEANRHFQLFHHHLVCRICQTFLPSDIALERHKHQHYLCNICGERFALYATMQQHRADVHGVDSQKINMH